MIILYRGACKTTFKLNYMLKRKKCVEGYQSSKASHKAFPLRSLCSEIWNLPTKDSADENLNIGREKIRSTLVSANLPYVPASQQVIRPLKDGYSHLA